MRRFLVHQIFLIIAALMLSAFANADEYDDLYVPANAFNKVNEPAPAHARLAGPNEFFNRFFEGELILDTPLKAPLARREYDKDNKQINLRSSGFLALHRPTLLYRITQIRDGADAPAQFKPQLGETIKLSLMGRDAVLREIVGAQLMFMDRSNQRALYDYFQFHLAGSPDVPAVPDPLTADANAFAAANNLLLPLMEARFGRDAAGKAPMDFGACEAEEGSGLVNDPDDGDQSGKSCKVNPVGLFAAADWALKTSNTCVRNQGERGTSAAFALTAAIEARVARDEKRYSNFSGQHLFHQMTSRWFRVLPDNEDNIAPILSSGIATTVGYGFHFEDIWAYNAAYDRNFVQVGQNKIYFESCKWYAGRHCSETNHQGRMLRAMVGENRFCGYDSPMTLATPVKVNNMAVVFDIKNPDQSLDRVRRLLRVGVPIVMTFGVPQSLLTNKGGYVGSPSESERYLGGQAALLSGYVPNHLRPSGAPEGAGGGYLVVKNSWGRCVGDAGYFYLPYAWVKAHAFNMTAVF